MAIEVRLPKLSDEMAEATISRWLKAVGDAVEKGEPIVEVETEKVIVEVESTHAGILVEILAGEQEMVAVDAVLCRIGKAGEVVQNAAGLSAAPKAPPPEPPAGEPREAANVVALHHRGGAAPPAAPGRGETVTASPLARRVAESLGIDLTDLTGSGAGGKIVMADLQPHLGAIHPRGVAVQGAQSVPSAPPAVATPAPGEPGREQPLGSLRRTVARRMAESKREVPHFYMTAEVDVTDALALRERLNRSLADGRISVNDLMLKATALALAQVPELNAEFTGEGLIRHPAVHLGFATAIDEGLVTPVVRDCHLKSLGGIARETALLIAKARGRTLLPADLQGGTFTISNLGMYPVVEFSAIINPPQAGILAIAQPRQRPVPEGERVVFRQFLKATLSADHRAVDGVTGARFLEVFKEVLESPERLML